VNTVKLSPKILILEEKCKGCGLCVHHCRRGCLEISEKFNSRGYHPVVFVDMDYAEKKGCNSCGFCYLICPDTAIEVYK